MVVNTISGFYFTNICHFLKNVYFWETEHEWRAERKGDTKSEESSGLCADSGAWTHEQSPTWGSNPQQWDHDLSKSWTPNQLSHPGAPIFVTFKVTITSCYCLSLNPQVKVLIFFLLHKKITTPFLISVSRSLSVCLSCMPTHTHTYTHTPWSQYTFIRKRSKS